MVLKNKINGLGPELFLDLFFKRCLSLVLSKSDPYDFIFQTWVMSSAVQKADKSSWWSSFRCGSLWILFLRCAYLFFVEHTSLGFGYVWIQYLIDFRENKIQGSQACRILLGSMVGICWIYALFGGSLLFGQKRMQPEHATKKKTTMDCDYLITPFCFYKAWNTYLKAGFGYVWIQYLIDFGENKIQGSQACRILLGSMVGIYWIYALFGGHYCLGRKGCSQNTLQKRKKLWIVITWLHHSASTKLEIHI